MDEIQKSKQEESLVNKCYVSNVIMVNFNVFI
jgi:hypothetical protein